MSYHLIKSPAKLSAGVEHAATNCGGDGQGQELVRGETSSTSQSMGASFSLHHSMKQTGELDKFTGWVTEVTWVVFMFSFSLAVAVLLVLWWCSRRRGGEYQDTEEQNQIHNGYLLRSPVTLYKSNEKNAEDGDASEVGVLKKEEDALGEGKVSMK